MQEADEEGRLYSTQGGFKLERQDAVCVLSKLITAAGGARIGGAGGQPKPQSQSQREWERARDGNIFETEQAPGLLIELDVGDKAKR